MPRKRKDQSQSSPSTFDGFPLPKQNYFRLPSIWIDITAQIDNMAELKIVQYILRHTWSFQEYGIKKRITIDEFVSGRKRKDGSRMDKGTGLSEQSVRNGLKAALEHGWIEELVDDRDRGRVKKFYGLKMSEETEDSPDDDGPFLEDEADEDALSLGVQSIEAGVQTLDPYPPNLRPRTPILTTSTNSSIITRESKSLERQTLNINTERNFNSKKSENRIFEVSDLEEGTHTVEEPETTGGGDYQPLTPSTNSLTAIRDLLKRIDRGSIEESSSRSSKTASSAAATARPGQTPRSGRNGVPEPPEWLRADITRLSDQLHDLAHVEDNIRQANNLFLFTGAEEGRFTERLNEAKATTLKKPNIEKLADGEAGELFGQRNKMPYFFKVLRDALGLKDIPASETKPLRAKRKGRGHNVNEQLYSP